MTPEQAKQNNPQGIIGITDDGYPIVASEHTCPYWQADTKGLCAMPECWYCKFSDFRKTSRMTLQKSICRNPRCRIGTKISGGQIDETKF